MASLCLGLLGGCGDSGGGSASASNSESQSGTEPGSTTGGDSEPTGGDSMSASSTGTGGGMSESLSGTTGAEGGMSESLSGTNGSGVESVCGSGTSGETTGMVSGGGETTGTSTGEPPVDCTTFDNEAECTQAGCLAIVGRLFVTDDADLCLDPPSFLACDDPMPCAATETYACKGMAKYQLPSACIPEGYMNCAMPPDQGGDGWDDCA
jgi:hypothetical protein